MVSATRRFFRIGVQCYALDASAKSRGDRQVFKNSATPKDRATLAMEDRQEVVDRGKRSLSSSFRAARRNSTPRQKDKKKFGKVGLWDVGLCLARVRNVIHTPLAFRSIPFRPRLLFCSRARGAAAFFFTWHRSILRPPFQSDARARSGSRDRAWFSWFSVKHRPSPVRVPRFRPPFGIRGPLTWVQQETNGPRRRSDSTIPLDVDSR